MTQPLASFDGTYFDGASAAATAVRVDLIGRRLIIWANDGRLLRQTSLRELELSEPFAHAPRLALLPDGATLEVPDSRGYTQTLGNAGQPPALIARLQAWWPATIVALVLLVASMVFAYTRGIPAAAKWAAFALPVGLEQRIGLQVLDALDHQHLAPSNLAASRRSALEHRFVPAAQRVAPNVVFYIEYRAVSEGTGINAFALPGGTIVLLDGLVEKAGNDDQVLAVLGHELGHVANKHGMRNVLQALGIGALAGLVWGDFAGIAANVPVIAGVLRYTRDFEREADDFAISFLRANDIPIYALIDFFEIVHQLRGKSDADPLPEFFSSHPATAERIRRLRLEAEAQK